MSLEPQPTLPPAIPAQDISAEHAWMVLGQEYAHRLQLQGVIIQRAAEANDLHDAVLALTGRQKELLDELAQHRGIYAELEQAHSDLLTAKAEGESLLQSKIADGQRELEAARNEAGGYLDEISRLKARLSKYEPLEVKDAA